MNSSIKRESLRTAVVYFDGKYMWAVDDIVGGLYKIDKKTMEIDCVIEALDLYKYDSFITASIIERDNYIILVPQLVGQKWVFYNKITKKILYQDIIGMNSYTPEVRIKGELVYIPPMFGGDPFIIYDLRERRINLIINNFLGKDIGFEIWRIFESGDTFYFPLRGRNSIYSIRNSTYRIIEINMKEKLGDADGKEDEYWILPLTGGHIYCIDDEGNVIEKVKVVIDGEEVGTENFIRIIFTGRYIFLLPLAEKDICVYDKSIRYFRWIKRESPKMLSSISYHEGEDTLPYYGYLKNEKGICLFPKFYKLMWIKFDTLDMEEKDIFLPYRTDYRMINQRIRMSRTDHILLESEDGDLTMCLKCIKQIRPDGAINDKRIGEKIYEYLQEKN